MSGLVVKFDKCNHHFFNRAWIYSVKGSSMVAGVLLFHNPSIDYEFFLTQFYILALHNGYSVYNSLNIVSWYWFGCSYANSELDNGFTADWPYFDEDEGWMKIYGNQNIYLY